MLSPGRKAFVGAHTALVVVVALVAAVVCLAAVASAAAGARPVEAQEEEGLPRATAAGGKERAQTLGDGNPIIYKSEDSRPGFDGGTYKHFVSCPDGYKAIGGGFDLNTRDRGGDNFGNHWQIQASRPAYERWDGGQIGDDWSVVAYGHTRFFDKRLPTFTAYAMCAPHDLIKGFRYEASKSEWLSKTENKTIPATCGRDERVVGGGFEFGGSQDVRLVRNERARDNERAWLTGGYNPNAGERIMRGWAVCVRSEDLEDTAYEEDAARVPNSGRAVANTPRCPHGMHLLSGGAGMNNNAYDSPSRPLWSNSSPPHLKDPDNWKASAVQSDHGPFTVHAFAMCGSFADDGGGKLSGKNPGWGDGMGGGRSR